MAAVSSSPGVTFLLIRNCRSNIRTWMCCSFRSQANFCRFSTVTINKSSTRGPVAVSATPETTGIQAFSDNPWLSLIAVLFVSVPLIRKLLELTKEVDTAAKTVVRIGVTVGKVAEDVDRAREDIAKALVDVTSGLKKVVTTVEVLAKDTIKDGEKVDDLIDKVDELEDKLDELLNK